MFDIRPPEQMKISNILREMTCVYSEGHVESSMNFRLRSQSQYSSGIAGVTPAGKLLREAGRSYPCRRRLHFSTTMSARHLRGLNNALKSIARVQGLSAARLSPAARLPLARYATPSVAAASRAFSSSVRRHEGASAYPRRSSATVSDLCLRSRCCSVAKASGGDKI